jgi:uncharacterized protein (DUF1778 family)
MRCDDRLDIRVSSDAKARIAQHAAAASLSVSDFVRQSVSVAVNRRAPAMVQERREIEVIRRESNSIRARLASLADAPGLPIQVAAAIKQLGRDATALHDSARTLLQC